MTTFSKLGRESLTRCFAYYIASAEQGAEGTEERRVTGGVETAGHGFLVLYLRRLHVLVCDVRVVYDIELLC